MIYQRNRNNAKCIHKYIRSTPKGQLKKVKLAKPELTDICKYCGKTREQIQQESRQNKP